APPRSGETRWVYFGDVQNVFPGVIPPIFNRSYTITAELTVPRRGAEGVIVPKAADLGGFALFFGNNGLIFLKSNPDVTEYRIASTRRLPAGNITVAAAFTADSEGTAGTGGTLRLRV